MDILCILYNLVTLHVEYEVHIIRFNILKEDDTFILY